jgi:fatty-acyl-CoA synthase
MSIKVYDWVAYHAHQAPSRLAIIDLFSGRQYTYGQMQERTTKLANGLRSQYAITRGDRVAALTNNTSDCLELEFACMKLGAIYVPLNWRLSVPELEYIVGDCAPKVLVHEDVFNDEADALKASGCVSKLLDLRADGHASGYESLIDAAGTDNPEVDLNHDDLWVIMYTSGTTGNPKGAMITYGMTFWNVINALTPHRVSEDMVNLVVLPLFHTGGLNCYANPAVHMGGANIIVRSFDPGECLKLLSDPNYGVTHMLAVPTNYLFMSQHPTFEQSDLSHVKTFGIGGAPTPKEMINTYAKRDIGLQQVFGMTETSPLVSALTAENAMQKIGSAGLPVLHNQVKIMTENGEHISTPETVGELWVKGPNITPGYWNKPEVNAMAFTDGWLHTGDAAYLDAEGFIYIVDRWKDMYISGGENVYPAEIENVIYQLPQVGEVAIIGVPDDRWGEVGQAIIVIKPEQTLDEQTVLKHCSDKLAKFKQPQSVRFIDEIPHNATGKVLKRELRLQS